MSDNPLVTGSHPGVQTTAAMRMRPTVCLQIYDTIDNGTVPDDWKIIEIVPKERELKTAARAGAENTEADFLSRNFRDCSDFSLDEEVVRSLFRKWGTPDIDLFASRVNSKCKKFFSFLPDPLCLAVDAFKQTWSGIYAYAFPPFNMVGRVVSKAVRERARLILVCPEWPSQPWWPLVQQHTKEVVRINNHPALLIDSSGRPHPCLLRKSFQLIACLI
ncbi:hypothetical protein COOONC_13863 [Cooperia oncophora]